MIPKRLSTKLSFIKVQIDHSICMNTKYVFTKNMSNEFHINEKFQSNHALRACAAASLESNEPKIFVI